MVIGFFCYAVVNLVVFMVWENKGGSDPMPPAEVGVFSGHLIAF